MIFKKNTLFEVGKYVGVVKRSMLAQWEGTYDCDRGGLWLARLIHEGSGSKLASVA